LAEVFDVHVDHDDDWNGSVNTIKHKVSVAKKNSKKFWRQYRVRSLT